MTGGALYIFTAIRARRRAMEAARAEAASLLRDLGAETACGGPRGEEAGVFWLMVPEASRSAAEDRLPRLGYTERVEQAAPLSDREAAQSRREILRWRGAAYAVETLYRADAAKLRESAPDRRSFLLAPAGAAARNVTGYRGDGSPTGRRALPVCDARLVVNLVFPGSGRTLVDPFAGAGGIVVEALECGLRVVSIDCDPALRLGLERLGARHLTADSARLPLAEESVDAVATEPPYDSRSLPAVLSAMEQLASALRSGGRIAFFCAAPQRDSLRSCASQAGLEAELDSAIDRKGTACRAMVWRKPPPPESHSRPA